MPTHVQQIMTWMGSLTSESWSKGCWLVKVRWRRRSRCFCVSASWRACDYQALHWVFLLLFLFFVFFLIGAPGWMSSDIVNGESFVNCLPPVLPFTRLCCLDSWETPLNRLPLLSVQQRHTVTYDHVYTYSAEQFGVHVACMCFIGRKQSSWWKFSKRNHKFQKRKAT